MNSSPGISALIVPIELSALPVDERTLTVADVSHRFDIEKTVDTPWLGQNTEPNLFQPSPAHLQAGIHLHWSLPKALTRGQVTFSIDDDVWATLRSQGFSEGLEDQLNARPDLKPSGGFETRSLLEAAIHDALAQLSPPAQSHLIPQVSAWISSAVPGKTTFPIVPNRWRVTRFVIGDPDATWAWIVESDHLRMQKGGDSDPCAAQNGLSPTTLALPKVLDSPPDQCYRYLGKVFPADTWKEQSDDIERHTPHTALGYGNPTFAAALPNCYNVFGLYDPLEGLPDSCQLAYSVIGWYSDTLDDPLAVLQKKGSDSDRTPPETLAAWAARQAWQWPQEAGAPSPALTLLSGMLLDIPWDKKNLPSHTPSPIQVAVGNSTAEALSALLARQQNMKGLEGVERYLNVLQSGLLGKLNNLPGVLKELDEALHQIDFGAVPSGTLWVLKDQSQAAPASQPAEQVAGVDQTANRSLQQAARQMELPLPEDLAGLLNNLNSQQVECDRLQAEIDWLRSQLFADWCNYLLTKHHKPVTATRDDGWSSVVDKRIKEAQQNLVDIDDTLNKAESKLDEALQKITPATESSLVTALAKDIDDRNASVQQVLSRLDQLRLAPEDQRLDYQLQPVSAPRFWQPNEPVVLFSGQDVQQPLPQLPAQQLTADGPQQLVCRIKTATGAAVGDLLSALASEAEGRVRSGGQGSEGSGPWSQTWSRPWRPLMMQWEAEFHAADGLTANDYDPDYLANKTSFGLANPNELTFGSTQTDTRPDLYSGSVLLTANAEVNIVEQARLYLRNYPAPTDGDNSESKQVRDDLNALIILPPMPLQSQALSGFNAALLARRQSIQLPVIDPNAESEDDYSFGLKIKQGVGIKNDVATLTNARFNPLRSGFMRLSRLWLVDAFGQVVIVMDPDDQHDDWPKSNAIKESDLVRSESFVNPDEDPPNPHIALRPRLVQPARLLFRWLSAQDDQMEMNSHPASSPIFGWIVANHLENSLALYDRDGNALGSLNTQGPLWQGAPGPFYEQPVGQVIPAGHLRDFTLGIVAACKSERGYLQALIDAIDDMTQYILPHSYSQHQALSVLMGRPLALARASLGMELLGQPAVDQSLEAFQDWAKEGTRKDRKLGSLRFPVRLGLKGHLNDALVGYFIEQANSLTTYKTFYVEDYTQGGVGVQAPKFDQLTVTTGSQTQPECLLTMLIDPRAPVHATTGILPVKQIEIPSNMIAAAIARLAVTFPIAPVFTPRSSLFSMDLKFVSELDPKVDATGVEWNPGWQAVSAALGDEFKAKGKPLGADARIIVEQSGTGWAINDTNTKYLIRNEGQTLNVYQAGISLPTPAEPGYVWSFLRYLAAAPSWSEEPVAPINRQADFSMHPQQIVDGWLQMRPAPGAVEA